MSIFSNELFWIGIASAAALLLVVICGLMWFMRRRMDQPMSLSGKQITEIEEALLDAFPTRYDLRKMVSIVFGEYLENIADGANQRVVLFNLITWAQRTGHIYALLQGASSQNPGNRALQQLEQTWRPRVTVGIDKVHPPESTEIYKARPPAPRGDPKTMSKATIDARGSQGAFIGASGPITQTVVSPQPEESLRLSISHPQRLAKGHSSPFLIDLYLSEFRSRVVGMQVATFEKKPYKEYRSATDLTLEATVTLELSSPTIEFMPSAKRVTLNSGHTSLHFVGIPTNTCTPGSQVVLLSIRDAESKNEYLSRSFYIQVVDFAFDHVSRPKLEASVSIVSAVGAVAVWTLSLLGQIDQTFGATSGTAAAALSAILLARMQWLYRAAGTTRQFGNPP